MSVISDHDLQRPGLSQIVAESFETQSGHAGIEGDSAERSGILANEITRARTLPGRALRSLYLHALQHLDVACRDLDAEGWQAAITIPDVAAATPEAALALMAENLRAAAKDFQNHTLRPHGAPQ